MSGEQHVPEPMDLDALEAGHDGLRWVAWQNVHAEVHAVEVGRGPFGVRLAPATGMPDYGRGEILQAVAVHNALPALIAAARRVRALPDRETIARLIYPESWEPPLRPETYRETMRAESLEKADAVLALFGQEGQR